MGNFYLLLFENGLYLSFGMCQVLEGRVLSSEKTKEKGGGKAGRAGLLGEALEGPRPGGYVGLLPSGQRPLKLPWLTHS